MTQKKAASRRDFLKAATAGTALAANLSLLSNVHAAGSDIIKIGLIGCGGRGTGAADNALHSADNVQIVALGDAFKHRLQGCRAHLINLGKKDEMKKRGNLADLPEDRCFVGLDAYEKVLNLPEVNYVILATPPGFRPSHLQAAVAAGKNIFTEKPVGVDGPGIRKVLEAYDAALKKNLCIAAGTQRRHELSYIETMKRIHGGDIGDITALRAYWNGNGIWFRNRAELKQLGLPDTDFTYQLHNWYHFVWVCGDHIVEQHVHNLDVCNWAMKGHPIRAVGMGGRTAGNPTRPVGNPNEVGEIFDHFAVDYEYPNGIHMLSMCRQIPGTESNVSEAIIGTKGQCNPGGSINGKGVLTREQSKAAQNPYVQEHTDLIASIRSGKPINELKNVAESTLTAILGRMTTYTGKAVTWDKALNSKLDTFPQGKLDWNMSLPDRSISIPGKTPLI